MKFFRAEVWMPAAPAFSDTTSALARAARDVLDAREAYDAARELRDQLILDAADQGMPQRAIAHATQLSQARIIAILLNLTGQEEAGAPLRPPPPTTRTPGTTRNAHPPRRAATAG